MESLTLRDQFAIAALQGEISAQDFKTGDCWNLTNSNDIKQLAERAYEIADAMLVARSKESQQ